MENVNGATAPNAKPPEHARELQLMKLAGPDIEFQFSIRFPAQFAIAYMLVAQSDIVDASGSYPTTFTPVVGYDSMSGGHEVKKKLVLVPFGRCYATNPDRDMRFLAAFIDPRTGFPTAVYEIIEPAS